MLKRLLTILVCLSALAIPARANNVFISLSGIGDQSGLTDCTHAKPVSYFNTAANWTTGTPSGTQIGPDTVAHMCGTFSGAFNSTMLTTGGAGTAGHPVIIYFEPGAVFTAPAWSGSGGGAIRCAGDSNIFIDGGGTPTLLPGAPSNSGVIKNTDNGTNFGHQINSFAISTDAGCNNLTIQNLNIQNMYVRVALSPAIYVSGVSVEESAGFSTFGSNVLITHNSLDHVKTGIGWAYCGSSNWEVSYNKLTFAEHGVTAGSSNTGCNASGANKIHDNDIGGGAYLWDVSTNDYHHDPIHLFASGNCTFLGVEIYRNFIHGIWGQDQAYFNSTGGTHITAFIFIEAIGDDAQIHDNIVDTSGGGGLNFGDNGTMEIKTSGTPGQNSRNLHSWNNTFVADNPAGKCMEFDSTGAELRNNICKGFSYAIYTPGGATTAMNVSKVSNNAYFGASNWGLFDSFAGWQSKVGDTGGFVADPQINITTYVPLAGSPVIAHGINLTSLGIPQLDVDFAGNARPSVGNWDIGAKQFGSAPPPPPPVAGPPPVMLSAIPYIVPSGGQ